MKNFILKMGESLLNVAVFVAILGVIITGIEKMSSYYGSFLQGSLIIIGGILIIIISTFFLYLLIDIRDKSAKTNELLSNILEKDKNL